MEFESRRQNLHLDHKEHRLGDPRVSASGEHWTLTENPISYFAQLTTEQMEEMFPEVFPNGIKFKNVEAKKKAIESIDAHSEAMFKRFQMEVVQVLRK